MLKRILIPFLLISSMMFPMACAAPYPVEIVKFSLSSEDYSSGYRYYIYLDYVSHFRGKTIEQAELTMEGSFCREKENDDHVTFRLFETEGIENNSHNTEHLRQTNVLKKDVDYTAYISKVYFTDGSIWENSEKAGQIKTSVWGNTRSDKTPLWLAEANFYQQYEGAGSIDYNVDWLNTSDEVIKAIVFEIIPKTTDGTVCKNESGEDEVIYITQFLDNRVLPGQTNPDYHFTLHSYDLNYTEKPTVFEIHPIRVLSDDGDIWDTSDLKPISCVLLGKKGYDFTEQADLKSVKNLIESLNAGFEHYGLNEGAPQIFVREKEFTVLRYQNVDIRAELDENNSLKTDSASFICYFPQSDYENPDMRETVIEAANNMYRVIFPAVFKDLPQNQLNKALDAYINEETKEIELDSFSMSVIEDGGLIYDKNGELLLTYIVGSGTRLNYNPSIKLLWARDIIY